MSTERATPTVSVVAVCYNHARFLVEALESVRTQSFSDWELIVVDDCSPDDSVERIRAWQREHSVEMELVVHERNQGVCRTLNDGVRRARGRYLAVMPCDDRWLPERLALGVELMERLPPRVGVAYSDALLIDEDGAPLPGMFIARHHQPPFPRMPEGDVFAELLAGNFIPGMTALIRRECFTEVGLFDETLAYEDWDFWLRVAERHLFAYIPQPTACYRISAGSMVHTATLRMAESDVGIYRRWLRRAPAHAALIRRRITEVTGTLYRLDHPRRRRLLLLRLCTQPSLGNAALLLASLLGLHHSHVVRLRAVARR
jgi:glycosyltransferase involved in cell wall biosynthesis